MNSNFGSVARPCAPGLSGAPKSFCLSRRACLCCASNVRPGCAAATSINGATDSSKSESTDWPINRDAGESLLFPPEVAVHLVKIACERPDLVGRSLSQWDCPELAAQLVRDGIVESISASTVQRILASHKLKPWRHHMWLGQKYPRDAEFYARVQEIVDLYTRPLSETEIVLSYDEKTSLQPRPRLCATRPARPGGRPNLCEHEYKRAGALQLFAAFDTRSGKVYGICRERKRQTEFIEFLEYLDREIPARIRTIHMIGDNLRVHKGKKVREWLKDHPRFQFHFTPVHCSWMNQIEQWFSILQRKRFRLVDFASTEDLESKIMQFICEWNEQAHTFNWTTKSVAKVMSARDAKAAA